MHSLHPNKHLHALPEITLENFCISVQSHASSPKNICTTIGVYSSPISWQTGSKKGSKKVAVNLGERRDFFFHFFQLVFLPH